MFRKIALGLIAAHPSARWRCLRPPLRLTVGMAEDTVDGITATTSATVSALPISAVTMTAATSCAACRPRSASACRPSTSATDRTFLSGQKTPAAQRPGFLR